jgi:error-prone DNA polymerase
MQVCMIAAGFSGGEADALRRAMAAWRRKGGVHQFHARVVEGMVERGYEREFAESIFRQILGFGDYGFPESHAYGFAILAYFSAWLKCHEPVIFTAALLNSQPMGFYAPSQLVQDLRRHGGEVRPPDVSHSDWDCTLEPASPGPHRPPRDPGDAHGDAPQPALRLGLRLIAGLPRADAERLVAARQAGGPWRDLPDLARRSGLGPAELERLARADALRSLAGHRRQQAWQAAGEQPLPALLHGHAAAEAALALPEAPEAEEVVLDHVSTGLSLRRHPLALLRPRLRPLGWRTAAELEALEDGDPVWAAGIVVTRQQPETAGGTVFVTLEDETGPVNVIVWRAIRDRDREALLGARLLAVRGIWQRRDGVRHLVARRLVDASAWLGRLDPRSRDFR